MTALEDRISVLIPEEENRKAFSGKPELKLYVRFDNRARNIKDLFIVVSATALPAITDVVREANESKCLRAIFVRADVDPQLLPQMMRRADLRTTRNLLVYTNEEIPLRVMNAWRLGAEEELIATAGATPKTLHVINCALEPFEIDFDEIPPLKGLAPELQQDFVIEPHGSYVYWKNLDVHLDIESLRYLREPEYRKNQDRARIMHDKEFGRAIAEVRKSCELKQNEIPGLSERQVRRIEKDGIRPTHASLCALAKAHGMAIDDYLECLANQMQPSAES